MNTITEKLAPRLGVNIDHVATLRRLRDTLYPDLLAAARECIAGGADQITMHLREDRRHVVDEDIANIRQNISVDLNFEMAATEEMLAVALRTKPFSICVVPEKREERTTEGGLDLSNPARNEMLAHIAKQTKNAGILVSFFIEPDLKDLEVSKKLGAEAVEFHTGSLCIAHQSNQKQKLAHEWSRLHSAIEEGRKLGLRLHSGHGIDYKIAPELGRIQAIVEHNIGHAIVCEAVFCGLREATRKMKAALLSSNHRPQ